MVNILSFLDGKGITSGKCIPYQKRLPTLVRNWETVWECMLKLHLILHMPVITVTSVCWLYISLSDDKSYACHTNVCPFIWAKPKTFRDHLCTIFNWSSSIMKNITSLIARAITPLVGKKIPDEHEINEKERDSFCHIIKIVITSKKLTRQRFFF